MSDVSVPEIGELMLAKFPDYVTRHTTLPVDWYLLHPAYDVFEFSCSRVLVFSCSRDLIEYNLSLI